jgi:hypothetical protein
VDDATTRLTAALRALVVDAPDQPIPGRIAPWLTELSSDWPKGSREAARAAFEASGLPYSEPLEST